MLELIFFSFLAGVGGFTIGLCARQRPVIQLPPLEIGPDGLPCLCGHQFNEHQQDDDMYCVHDDCSCQAFILKRSAAR